MFQGKAKRKVYKRLVSPQVLRRDTESTSRSVETERHRPEHPCSNDVTTASVITVFLVLYLVTKDWLLLAVAVILTCLYVLYIRRSLLLPPWGTHHLQTFLENI